jgi:DDE superfamily endonuclease
MRQVAKACPRRELHVVLDDYHTHKHPEVQAWLAKTHRITVNFTPTSEWWMNIVEIFFGIITRQAIRRATFANVKELISAISRFIDAWNDRCQPLTWTKTADEILFHATRQAASDARHSTPPNWLDSGCSPSCRCSCDPPLRSAGCHCWRDDRLARQSSGRQGVSAAPRDQRGQPGRDGAGEHGGSGSAHADLGAGVVDG